MGPLVGRSRASHDRFGRARGPWLRRYLRLFNAIATISPLLGLLGTVFGMIRLFNQISSSDAMGRTELLAGGISEALLTTAGGLSVAIPALCIYLLFVGRVDRLLIDIDALGPASGAADFGRSPAGRQGLAFQEPHRRRLIVRLP